MTLATSIALLLVVRQAELLAHPQPFGDLWHLYNISTELDRLERSAVAVMEEKATGEDLDERLEIAMSLLAPGDSAPHTEPAVARTLPGVRDDLDHISHTVDTWSGRTLPDAAATRVLAAEIAVGVPKLRDRLEQSFISVHTEISNQLDRDRTRLHARFVMLSWLLGSLLIGVGILGLRLFTENRRAHRLSSDLLEFNRTLESRIEERTREIRDGRELLRLILESSPSDVVLVEVASQRVRFITDRFAQSLGLAPERGVFALRNIFVDPLRGELFAAELDARGGLDGWEDRIAPASPYWSALYARKLEVAGEAMLLLWSYDVSARKALEAELQKLATVDSLSGLLNRRAFLERGSALVEHCVRLGHPCSVLMIDIDHFKRINDTHGHQAGDDAIRALADVLTSELRHIDVVGRLGGEEFAAVLPETPALEAEEIAERLCRAVALQRTSLTDEIVIGFTVSIGVGTLAEQTHGALESLLLRADRALYRAKAQGRNRIALTTEDESLLSWRNMG